MHSFGRYCTAVIVALASLDVCAQADLKAALRRSSAAVPSSAAKVPPTAGANASRLPRRGTKNCLPRSRASRNPPASLSRISVWSSTATGASSSGTLPAGSRTTRSGRPPPFRRRRSSGSVRSATNTARSSFFNGCAINTRTARCRPRRDRKSKSSRQLPRRQPRPQLLRWPTRRFAPSIARCSPKSSASRSSSIARCPSIRSVWKDPRACSSI